MCGDNGCGDGGVGCNSDEYSDGVECDGDGDDDSGDECGGDCDGCGNSDSKCTLVVITMNMVTGLMMSEVVVLRMGPGKNGLFFV